MMCDNCGKNPATTHLKTVVNGVVHENHLCSYCAANQGYGNIGKLSLTNMLASMFGESISSGKPISKRCECCGASFSDIAQSGRVGCSECYNTFRQELMPSLNRLHGKAVHIGNAPDEQKPEETVQDKIKKLKAQLSDAIKAEEFENAAKLRDEIRALEGEENNA
ncbi:MAG: UvrB/UvrC motif-containing protein [Clostridia bacterium]|nr:UvrB/UvrC motif-containing protein [Clostridia bacterium]